MLSLRWYHHNSCCKNRGIFLSSVCCCCLYRFCMSRQMNRCNAVTVSTAGLVISSIVKSSFTTTLPVSCNGILVKAAEESLNTSHTVVRGKQCCQYLHAEMKWWIEPVVFIVKMDSYCCMIKCTGKAANPAMFFVGSIDQHRYSFHIQRFQHGAQ